RSLRATQHFDAIEVEDLRGYRRSQAVIALLDGGVIDIEAGRRGAGRRGDTANRDVGIAQPVVGGDGQGRRVARDVIEILDALAVEGLLAHGGNADWDRQDGFRALLRRNDDLLESHAARRILGRGSL